MAMKRLNKNILDKHPKQPAGHPTGVGIAWSTFLETFLKDEEVQEAAPYIWLWRRVYEHAYRREDFNLIYQKYRLNLMNSSMRLATVTRMSNIQYSRYCWRHIGYTMATSQLDWKDDASISVLGVPRLGFLVSAGNMDSMVNHYSVSKKTPCNRFLYPGRRNGKATGLCYRGVL